MTSKSNAVSPKAGTGRVSGASNPESAKLDYVWKMFTFMLEEGWTPIARDVADALRKYAQLFITGAAPPPPEVALHLAELLDKRQTSKTKGKHRGRPKRALSLTKFENLSLAARDVETIEFRLWERGIRGAKEKALAQVAEKYSITPRHLRRLTKFFPPPPISPEDVIES